MPLLHLDTLDDPRLGAYRNLKDRELAREGGLFIAEGEHLVRRLLESDFPIESVLLAQRRVAEIGPRVPPAVPLLVLPDAEVDRLIGFKFHSGAMACARRKPPAALDALLPRDRAPLTLVICPEIANAANLGSMVRLAAAFGVDAMLLGERRCDPFWRQAVRVSMGAVFRLPIHRSTNLLSDLLRLRDEFGVELAAAVLDESAELLASARRPPRFALLFGNEAQGLSPAFLAAARRRLTIPMRLGVDSLNVAVAAGIFLYHFTRPEAFAPQGV